MGNKKMKLRLHAVVREYEHYKVHMQNSH